MRSLRDAGAIILGKTNVMQALAGWEWDNPVYGRANNPWDLARTPGGSSGGEGAIIAAGGSPLGLASDLGGSIRFPAYFCGVHGFKPTSGRFTNEDTPADIFSLGQEAILPQPGPIARRVEDLSLMLSILSTARPAYDVTPPVAWTRPGGRRRGRPAHRLLHRRRLLPRLAGHPPRRGGGRRRAGRAGRGRGADAAAGRGGGHAPLRGHLLGRRVAPG